MAPTARQTYLPSFLTELLAQTLFVIIGCGFAMVSPPQRSPLAVSFVFGLGITVLVYSSYHIPNAGQINPAVTFSLMLGGEVPPLVGLVNMCAQFLGSVVGALFLRLSIPCENDFTQTIGSNRFDDDKWAHGTVYLLEFLFTFLLCHVVWQVAVSPRSKGGTSTPLAIGLAVFLAHIVLIPIDGCSINPSRSFGPAVVSKIMKCDNLPGKAEWGGKDLVAWLIFPLLGGAAAAGFYKGSLKLMPTGDEVEEFDAP